MVRHRRMAVDAQDRTSAIRGEEIAEDHEPAQVGRSYPDWNRFGGKYLTADLQRATEAASFGRRVESRTDFVLNDCRVELAHAGKDRGQVGRHPLRRARPRIAGEPYRLASREASQLSCSGSTKKKHARYAIAGELLEHIGRSGEVVAVVTVEERHEGSAG